MNKQQSGSVIVYALVSVVLVGALIGGIVFSQKRAERVAVQPGTNEQPALPAPDPATPGKDEQVAQKKAEEEKDAEKAKQQQKAAKDKAQKEQAQQEAKEQELARKAAEAEREATQTPSASPEGPMARTGGPAAGDLPQTGPVADAFMAALGLIAIYGAGYVYYHYGRQLS